MRVRLLCLAALALMWSADVGATTFYVDQTAGSDRNAGTSPASPWKHVPGMSLFNGSRSLSPGDTVYFDRGDTWTVTGTQGIYLVGGVTYVGDAWGAGARRATIRAGADLDAGIVRFRDHATIETVFRGFEVDGAGRVTSGVDMNHAFYVSPLTGATKRVQDTEIHHITARQAKGQYKYGLIVSNFGGPAGAVENVEIVNVSVHDVPRDAICLYPGDVRPNSRIRNIVVRQSEVYNTGQDPAYCCGAGVLIKGYVQDAFIEYNYLHDVKGAAVFVNGNENRHYGEGQRNIHIRHNILTNASGDGAIRIYDGASGGDPKDIKIYGNVIYDSPRRGGLFIGRDLKGPLDLLVHNNTFYDAPVTVERTRAPIHRFEFRNNIVYASVRPPLVDESGVIRARANNVYFRRQGALVIAGGLNYSAQTLTRYESSARSVDPEFAGPPLPTGFVGTYGVDLAPNRDGLRPRSRAIAADQGSGLGRR
jgi:hypothetical protein